MIKKTTCILCLIILIHLILISLSADQLFYGDEVVYITPAEEISEGNIAGHMLYENGKLAEDKSTMLIHPPTYIYLLSLFMFLFGKNPFAIRAVSGLFSIGVITLIYLITKKILIKRNIENFETWSLIAALVYAISPMAIQNSLLVEIDGGLLNFFVLLFIYLYISKKPFIYLLLSLFMIFWSKLTAPPLLFASLFLLNLGAKDFKGLLKTIKLFILAGISFFLSFFLYAKIFNLNWHYLFSHNSILGILKVFFQIPLEALAKSLWGFKIFFYFATPFLIFLFLLVSYQLIIRIIKYKSEFIKSNNDLMILWLYSLMTIGLCIIASMTSWNFAKYHITALPLIIILVIYFMPKKIKNIKKALPIILFTLVILITYFIIFLGDPLLPEIDGRFRTTPVIGVVKLVLMRSFMYAIIPIGLSFALFLRIPKKRLWLVLFFLLIFTSVYLNIIQLNADYSTRYIYGDKGLNEILYFMNDKPPAEILCYPHVGYYLGALETYELTTLYYNLPELTRVLNEENINWIILYEKDLLLIRDENLKNFRIEKEIENYRILKRI